jgi:hypothetical protein
MWGLAPAGLVVAYVLVWVAAKWLLGLLGGR